MLTDALVFSVEGEPYRWRDVILSAVRWGGWHALETQVREGAAAVKHAEATAQPLPDGALDAEGREFRYALVLVSARSMEEWLAQHIAPRGAAALSGAHAWIEVAQALADEVAVASTQGSLYSRISGKGGRNSYPFFLTRGGAGQIGFGWLGGSPALEDEAERKGFYDRFNTAVGPLSTSNLKGYPAFKLDLLTDPKRLEAFRDVARDFVAACRA